MIENTPELADSAHGISLALTGATDGGAADILGVMIPIVAIIFGVGIGMLSMYLDYRKKRDIFALHHQERMAAIEKGMEVPPLPAQLFENSRRTPRTRSDYLRRGLVWLLVGGAITVALHYQNDGRQALWGLVPGAVGLAYLLFYYLDGRKGDAAQNGH